MARPVTLFTGQWADLPLEELAEKAGRWGFDGLELACWGDHFEVDRALAEDDYVGRIQEILERNHLNCFALGAHLVGQAVCDPIDDAPPRDPAAGGLGRRRSGGRPAARRRADEGHRARGGEVRRHSRSTASPARRSGTCSTPSRRTTSPRSSAATRTSPSAGRRSSTSSTPEGVKFGLEVHPTEIAYDFVTTRKTLDAIGNREGFGINLDPSPLRAPVPRHRAVRARVRATGSTTSTSRTRGSAWTGGGRSSARTSTSARRRAAGTSSRPATATSTSRSSSAR